MLPAQIHIPRTELDGETRRFPALRRARQTAGEDGSSLVRLHHVAAHQGKSPGPVNARELVQSPPRLFVVARTFKSPGGGQVTQSSNEALVGPFHSVAPITSPVQPVAAEVAQ